MPSTWNQTPATATLSEAVAFMVAVPDIVAPLLGDVSDTVGGVVSAAAWARLPTGPKSREFMRLIPYTLATKRMINASPRMIFLFIMSQSL